MADRYHDDGDGYLCSNESTYVKVYTHQFWCFGQRVHNSAKSVANCLKYSGYFKNLFVTKMSIAAMNVKESYFFLSADLLKNAE